MSGVRVLVGTRKGAFILTSDGGAQRLGGERAAFRRLGDLPPQGFAGRPEPALRLAVQRLVRADDPALRRRRRDLGTRSATSSATTASRARTSGTTARRIRGSSSASGTWSRRSTDPGHGLRRGRGRGAVPLDRRRADLAGTARAARATAPGRSGSRAPAGCACTPSCSIPSNPKRMYVAISAAGAFRTDDGGATWKPINQRPALAVHPRPRRRGRPLRPPHRHASVAARHAVHAEALGRHAQRRRRRVVARGQRQPADRLRLPDRRPRARAGDHLRRADQERLGALTRPRASCASTAAARAATTGRR